MCKASKELRNKPPLCRVTWNGCVTQSQFPGAVPFLRLPSSVSSFTAIPWVSSPTGQVIASPSFLPALPGRGPYSSSLDWNFPLALTFPLRVSGPLLTPVLLTAASLSTGGAAHIYSVDIGQLNAYGPCRVLLGLTRHNPSTAPALLIQPPS